MTRPRARPRRGAGPLRAPALCAAIALASVTACHGDPPRTPVGVDEDAHEAVRARRRAAKAAAPIDAPLVTSLPEHTVGPFFARRRSDGAGMIAWVAPGTMGGVGGGRRVVVAPIDPSGRPHSGEKKVAAVNVDTTMLVVRPMRGQAPGFVLPWTSLTDGGESLYSLVVDDDGTPRGKPVELARTRDDVVWVGVVPTSAGAVCLWAEETADGTAKIIEKALDTDGKVRGAPARVANGVVGWHALELSDGVGLSTVAPAKDKGREGGTLRFQRLDAEGRARGAPVVISKEPVVSGDVEVVRDGERLLFAWTDRTADEPFVGAATLDGGEVSLARKLVDQRGGAALLGLAAGAAGASVMWQSPARPSTGAKRVYVARLAAKGLALGRGVASFEDVGEARSELSATATGFAVLAPLRDCDASAADTGKGAPTCLAAPVLPTVVRMNAELAVVQRQPFAFDGDSASIGWGMTCAEDTCYALAASGNPARLRLAEVRARDNARAAAPVARAPEAPSRLRGVTAIASGATVIDLAAAHFGDASLVASLAANAKAPSGAKTDALRAASLVLSTRVVDDRGAASDPVVLSTRALAVGGVAVAPAGKPSAGGAVAWVARENGDPEVHVTRIDAKGKRTNDVQLTTVKGTATDVSIVWAGDGWIVAWVDGRRGNGEVYATKVDLGLRRIAREERITKAEGDASDLVALGAGDVVWLAWADPRDSVREGLADIYAASVGKRDAKRRTPDIRLLATAAHSRTPVLAPAASGISVAWVEQAPLRLATPADSGYGAMWAVLDGKGNVTRAPERVPTGGKGAASSISLEHAGGGLRAVVARSTPDAIALDAVELGAEGARAFPLLALDGPPSLDVRLVLLGGAVYFNDDGPEAADKRARRAVIAWSEP